MQSHRSINLKQVQPMVGLKPKQIAAATMLASGKTGREVAAAIGCTPETLSHWKRAPEFEACLNGLRWEILDAGREALRSAALVAVNGLVELAQGAKAEEVRRKACVDVLEMVGLRDQQAGTLGWDIGPVALHARIRD